MLMLSWKQSLKSGSIAKQLDTLTEEQLQANRSYIKSVDRVVELCGRQGIALRVHDESETSHNMGNFWRF